MKTDKLLARKLAKLGFVLPEEKLNALVEAEELNRVLVSERKSPQFECTDEHVEFGDEE